MTESEVRISLSSEEWGLIGPTFCCSEFANKLNEKLAALLCKNLSREAVIDEMHRVMFSGQSLGAYNQKTREVLHGCIRKHYGEWPVYIDLETVYNGLVNGD